MPIAPTTLFGPMSMEFIWLIQVIGYYAYILRKDEYTHKIQAALIALAWILLCDAGYYLALHYHANFIAMTVAGGIIATLQFLAPKLAPKFMKDSDPLAEKMQRLCRLTTAIGLGVYLAIFVVAPRTTMESMMGSLVPNITGMQNMDDGTGGDANPLGDMIPGVKADGSMAPEDAEKLLQGAMPQ